MDSTRFDNMTRLLGSGRNRRQVIRGLLGGAGALAVAGTSHQLTSAQTCQPLGQSCQNDSNPCCRSMDCVGDDGEGNGVCQCQEGERSCNGACIPSEFCCTDDECAVCERCLVGFSYICDDIPDCCVDDSDCPACSSCTNNVCVPYAEYCQETHQCYNIGEGECCTSADCGNETCVDGHCCPPGYNYCPDGDFCYTNRQGTCCTSADCGTACYECTNYTCTFITGCCVDDSDCPACSSCTNNVCVPYAEYCQETHQCYYKMEGECCTDDDCDNETCVDGHCCPPGYKYCPDGDFCYTNRQGECCTNADCGTACDEHHHCIECPSDEIWCVTSQKCVNLTHECCTDDDCPACNTCGQDNHCTETNCCDTNRDCDNDEICCNGICVDEHDPCCQQFGETCGLLNVAGGDDRQYDCCDGLLCCFGQATNVCGECCADSDCDYAPGGVCNHFQCQYPTCEGKYEACDSDSDCCHGLKCHDGICKHPHKPHPKPTPDQPVTTLPATGGKSGANDSSAALGITLAAGAAALLGAKVLRQHPTETGEDA